MKLRSHSVPCYLAVLKTFGARAGSGLMSFAMPGHTLALDLPMTGGDVLAALDEIDQLVADHGGRVYAAKDARMGRLAFRRFYPQAHEFAHWIDPKLMSSFWERLHVKAA